MKKILAVSIILFFIGIAVAPSINHSVVTASIDDDLVEVTSQACGIKGYKDTTVKLTREQYQDLEQYLVEFRARLNQTTSREEAIPLFKDAVVELDKYGLLPEGMSVRQAQDIVTSSSRSVSLPGALRGGRILYGSSVNNRRNLFCLVVGHTNHTWFETAGARLSMIISEILYSYDVRLLSYALFFISLNWYVLCNINPLNVLNIIYVGCQDPNMNIEYPASGWVTSIGVFGIQKNKGSMTGALPIQGTYWPWYAPEAPIVLGYPAVVGFSGFKIGWMKSLYWTGGDYDYLGSAVWVRITSDF
ncbi:hypothetical protein AYK25_00985 [Thermoplasmatales archaeon SM1-50]|nr:MAG: hypothetical protein AYK25_00985 [Thermoplasmatales archaeon SM1-50]